MSWFPGATNKNIPPGTNDPSISPRIIVLHTMVGTIEGADSWFRTGGTGVEAHFGVAMDGRVWQWRDTSIQADAQAAGNDYCISIETEDMGQPEQRWTPIQFQRLVELMTWLGQTHNIPMRLVTSTSEHGIGYHRQFPEWNPNNHSCPGDIRLAQLKNELLPALQGVGMAFTAEDKQWLLDNIKQEVTNTYRLTHHNDATVKDLNDYSLKHVVSLLLDVLLAIKAIQPGSVDAGAVVDEMGKRLTNG